MNHVYRTIWNETLGTWVAVAETVKRCGKRSSSVKALAVTGILMLAGLPVTVAYAVEVTTCKANNVCTEENTSNMDILIQVDASGSNNHVGSTISGGRGKSGHDGALFVPPASGKPGGSVGNEYSLEGQPQYDNASNTITLIYKDNQDPPHYKKVVLTPKDNLESDTPTYAVKTYSKQGDASYDNGVSSTTSAALEVGDNSLTVKIPEYGLSFGQTDNENTLVAGAGSTLTDPFNVKIIGVSSGSNIIFSANSQVGAYGKSEGGDGGNGGTYWLGGKGKPGGAGGDASDVSLNVENININMTGKSNTGVLASSSGGDGGDGGGSKGSIVAGGGGGNMGGDGKTAKVDLKNTHITMSGEQSTGVAAISQGGAGGDGGGASGIVSTGGKGSVAGNAGNALVVTDGNSSIRIVGDNANGVVAQSIAGVGGNSGSTIGIAAIGGVSGSGGNAGTASVTNSATIEMKGENSNAILAQSIGGGGGNGGTITGIVALGATQGAGGDGQDVSVSNNGRLSTSGATSIGILAQSIGGGGGNSGKGVGFVSIGGKGGAGGEGGKVMVTNTDNGTITTKGSGSYGIAAQSIGGGGGNGSLAVGVVSIGGKGGAGNDGKEVTVQNSGDITTGQSGDLMQANATVTDSSAILAQSIGGGGGNGGAAISGGLGFAISIGGDGSGGGQSDQVNVILDKDASLTTFGNNSSGIRAQSIGGGGGNGGAAISGALNVGAGASIAIGGNAAKGGNSGKVTVNAKSGQINTYGDRSTGITAQSIGGAGGDAGISVAATAGLGAVSATVALGGNGGTGGKSAEVDVISNANIITRGADSTGILAQSIGGSGGSGGITTAASAGSFAGVNISLGGNGGTGGRAASSQVNNTGTISTYGESSSAIVSQSIGGNGGNAGGTINAGVNAFNVGVNLGGSGGHGGTAGQSLVANTGQLYTTKNNSLGILSQSIGGNGGNSGLSITGAAGLGTVGITLGGDGGTGGKAGLSSVINHGKVVTVGENATAIVSQSIGGSGGYGSSSISGSAGLGNVNVTFGGAGGTGGQSAAASVINHAGLGTHGDNASAIVVQSIAGDGGNGGFAGAGAISNMNVNLSKGGTGGTAAKAGTASIVTSNQLITTQGANSSALIAQSIGGNGGNGGVAVSGTIGGQVAANVSLGGSGGAGGQASDVIVRSIQADPSQISMTVVENEGQKILEISSNPNSMVVLVGEDGQPLIYLETDKNGYVSYQASELDLNKLHAQAASMINTAGPNSNGIVAQSLGGGGGNGGMAIAATLNPSGSGLNAGVSLGGDANVGGKSGNVNVSSDYIIQTEGANSAGIVAQSFGGTGGNGGFAISGAAAVPVVNAQVALGGVGNHGGTAGETHVTSTGSIYTQGDFSAGVIAQSVGGSGGNGGFSVAAGAAVLANAAVSIGGAGGRGGIANQVTVDLGKVDLTGMGSFTDLRTQSDLLAGDLSKQSLIRTDGQGSVGALAQSIGGSGGNGGFSTAAGLNVSPVGGGGSASVSLGGDGGYGGQAGDVRLNSAQSVLTAGNYSNALQAQSIGGAGGAGGFSVAGALSGALEGPSIAVAVSLGGSGGNGGQSSHVSIQSIGDILTEGHFANGVIAQSTAGNGGTGGFSGAFTGAVAAGGPSISGSVSIGGDGGHGGHAGMVNVDVANQISTKGNYSSGIVAQSQGGNGGVGGISASGAISVSPSVAGAVGASVGGNGGQASQASSVTVNHSKQIATQGDFSQGILAQSINGNGGAGGASFSGTLGISNGTSIGANVTIGGNGGGNTLYDTDKNGQAVNGIYKDSTGTLRDIEGYRVDSNGQRINSNGQSGNDQLDAAVWQSYLAQNYNARVVDKNLKDENGNDIAVTVNNIQGDIATQGNFSGGIVAQAIGGNGGVGGLSIGGSGTAAQGTSANASVTIGGGGGNGGAAAKVNVSNIDSVIQTKGNASNGILAQSIGGNGGDGGMSVSGSLAVSASGTSVGLSASVGGNGGKGNTANQVTVKSEHSGIYSLDAQGNKVLVTDENGQYSASIATEGHASNGIAAQSIGGGGGNGGISGNIVASLNAGGTAAAVGVSVGGNGGQGNTSGRVEVSSIDNIITKGNDANGILAQSIAGGGGNGGSALSATLSGTVSQSSTIAANFNLGGKGGSGNIADDVYVSSDGVILTQGDASNGILAQSIGGGGGNGGMSVGANLSGSQNGGYGLNIGIGGNGATGGAAGNVTVNREFGFIQTAGNNAAGIAAQSLGGGGGNGGMVLSATAALMNAKTATFSLGGFGGTGNTAGQVLVNNQTQITTQGHNAQALLAQSIGGGGGNGGLSTSVALDGISTKSSLALNLAVGGFGGTGGTAGQVSVKNISHLATLGDSAQGILAQSIGGGGGNGGSSLAGTFNMEGLGDQGKATTITATLGGFGGKGNTSNVVEVDQTGSIYTEGFNSSAIQAQSIGGGGGNGGNASSKTFSLECGALCDLALGEGGSTEDKPKKPSDLHISASIGGWAGSGNDSARVSVNNHGSIETKGDGSNGIYAQSIGGGGGDGGNALVDAKTYNLSTDKTTTQKFTVGIGGYKGSAGQGGEVSVNHVGQILTHGNNAKGILAQSVGGGGGNGGNTSGATVGVGGGAFQAELSELNSTLNDLAADVGLDLNLPDANGSSGDGDTVTVNTGYFTELAAFTDPQFIYTQGNRSDAIFAQSIGGGGGIGGSATGTLALGGDGGKGGHGGAVTVNNAIDLWTEGFASNGIFAQSIGGGGGIGGDITDKGIIGIGGSGSMAGNAGKVSLSNTATTISTLGDNARGLVAQSIGGGGGAGGGVEQSVVAIGGGSLSALLKEAGDDLAASAQGGDGGQVILNNGRVDDNKSGAIYTQGIGADAILAQSIGGGGGAGGNASGKVAVGGMAAGAGDADQVKLDNFGILLTKGKNASGIVAQSIGGGGGKGGDATGVKASTIDPDNAKAEDKTAFIAIGGAGANAGQAGTVDVSNNAFGIWTEGDNSRGILAQSIGGGGGVGGDSEGYLALGGGALNDIISMIKNDGHNQTAIDNVGGNAGNVSISNGMLVRDGTDPENYALIYTQGNNADAIVAQSIAGGGGVGGNASGLLALGGSAGNAGHAGKVSIENAGSLVTKGKNSSGIIAQSIAGSGGIGGDSNGLQGEDSPLNSIVGNRSILAIGGSGAAAGNAEMVTVTNIAEGIWTEGDHSRGILAQSLGGGGGIAGDADGLLALGGGALNEIISMIKNDGNHPTATNNVGGNAGNVSISNGMLAHDGAETKTYGLIYTQGNNADAIVAQSIAGGGGVGGNASGLLALGGSAGNAGHAGKVSVENTGSLITKGKNSSGIVAQSIAGGGGLGGDSTGLKDSDTKLTDIFGNSAILALGGNGAQGGQAGSVTIRNTAGGIWTEGDHSRGILAQSLGGAGGIGGDADGLIAIGGHTNAGLLSSGGDAGQVTVTNGSGAENGFITTLGNGADAIVAQSISGSGGVAGNAKGALSLGGSASAAGTAGDVSVNNAGILWTEGHNASGIIAQSIAGDGGIGGNATGVLAMGGTTAAGANAGKVTISNSAKHIVTKGDNSRAILAQSIAGSGGVAGNATTEVTLGGHVQAAETPLTGGHASDVSVTSGVAGDEKTEIWTTGKGADAIVAQSIAGGGGVAGLSTGKLMLGSTAADAGNAGNVVVENHSHLFVEQASGIVAQSIAGGGGLSRTAGDATLGIMGNSGQAGSVTVNNFGQISLSGDGGVGILAQSISGGGGYVAAARSANFDNAQFNTGLNHHFTSNINANTTVPSTRDLLASNSANAADVHVINNADIITQGDYSHGIVAQSIAGGGGYVNLVNEQGDVTGFAANSHGGEGTAGNVSIEQNGNIVTNGQGSFAIYAQSAGQQRGDISININGESLIVGGSESGAAIGIFGGRNNTLTNNTILAATGTQMRQLVENGKQLISVGAIDGNIVLGDIGNNTLLNNGIMTGSLALGSGKNYIENAQNAWFISGSNVQLGQVGIPNSGLAHNLGHLSVGGVDAVYHTDLIGDFTQAETGIYYWDYDLNRASQTQDDSATSFIGMNLAPANKAATGLPVPAYKTVGSSDFISVSGTVDLAGTLSINLLSPGKATPGISDQLMVSGQQVTDHGLILSSVPSAVIKYSKVLSDDALWVRSDINYSADGLTLNGHSVGNVVNRIQTDQISSRFEPIAAALLYQPDVAALQRTYDSISGQGNVAIQQSAFNYGNNILSAVSQQSDFWRTSEKYSNQSVYNLDCQAYQNSSAKQDLSNQSGCNVDTQWRVWLAGSLNGRDIDADHEIGTGKYKASDDATTIGLDYQVNPSTLVGIGIGTGKTTYTVTDPNLDGSVKANSAVFYAAKNLGNAYLKGAVSVDWIRAKTEREAVIPGTDEPIHSVPGIANQLEAKFSGNAYNARIEAGLQKSVNKINITPFVGLQASILHLKSMTEDATGDNNDLALAYQAKTVYSIPLFFGAQIDKDFVYDSGVFQPYVRLTLAHDFSTKRAMESSFVSAPGYNFEIKGARPDANSAEINLGFKMITNRSVTVYGQLDGRYAKNSKYHGGAVGVSYRW